MPTPDINLYLYRHAESKANVANHLIGGRSNESELSELGTQQARKLGAYIARGTVLPTAIYASPAIRTLSTATIATKEAGLKTLIRIDDRLQELSQGDWTGHVRAEIYTPQKLAEISKIGKDFKAPGGESMNEVGARMFAAINDISDSYEPKSEAEVPAIFVFSHGLAIRCLASYIHNWSHERTYKANTPNVSESHFTRGGDKWRLQYLGRNTL